MVYYVSCRRDWADARHFSGALQFDPAKPKIEPRGPVLILVHGYNNPAEAVYEAYQGMDAVCGGWYDTVIGFLWPGGDIKASFPLAVIRANQAGPLLAELVNSIDAPVDIETHSLGARVGLAALNSAKCRNLILTAPAVDDECLEPGEEFHSSALNTKSTYVMHSHRDEVLGVAYRFGDAPEFDRALGWKGAEHSEKFREFPHIRFANCESCVSTHGGYRFAPQVFNYWKAALDGQVTQQFSTL